MTLRRIGARHDGTRVLQAVGRGGNSDRHRGGTTECAAFEARIDRGNGSVICARLNTLQDPSRAFDISGGGDMAPARARVCQRRTHVVSIGRGADPETIAQSSTRRLGIGRSIPGKSDRIWAL